MQFTKIILKVLDSFGYIFSVCQFKNSCNINKPFQRSNYIPGIMQVMKDGSFKMRDSHIGGIENQLMKGGMSFLRNINNPFIDISQITFRNTLFQGIEGLQKVVDTTFDFSPVLLSGEFTI